ncbi:MAG: S9 family peptidase [Flavobacteriales bacterium]|nr:S9 family peptidase [Flavobacteriales bacterium]MBP6697094.1 S9 family peptidase [Flavobacteriales bacterium]
MNKTLLLLPALLAATVSAHAQQATIPVGENLTVEGIPPLPTNLIGEVRSYTEARGAGLAEWHPLRKEMLITTRFGNSNQFHYVKFPGGDRKQITFFEEPVGGATFEPKQGSYFVFTKDIGGNEFDQLHRFDLKDNKVSLLTDGRRSQNGGIKWSHAGDRIAYASTMRNGKDRDIRIMAPLDSATDRVVAENSGGGWGVADWSPDDTRLLLNEGLSVNESRIHIADVATGTKTRILPKKDERTTYRAVAFTKDGKSIYLISNKDSEFNRLCLYDPGTDELRTLTADIPWDVNDVEHTKDGSKLAFTTNENGMARAYILTTATNTYEPVRHLPIGMVGGLRWNGDGTSLGLTMASHASTSDVYEYEVSSGKLTRWTESELGGLDPNALREPQLIIWNSFDQRPISGYLYRPPAKFTGKRPVIINIHGGPEGQFRPSFMGRNNYYMNELGAAVLFPNVRGSSGYGKTFLDLDNGMDRENSVKDIGALLDWIAQQPDLDADRIMVTGGSYGGYMTLAVAYHYSDRIRCALDVVGISNFNTFLKNTEDYRRDLRRAEYGDERDPKMAAFFEEIAPLNHTDKIKKPLFIVQGGNDPRVPASEAVQMKDRIKQGGGTVWFLMADDEGHGFRKKDNVDFQFYATIAFVREYLLR